MPETKINFIHIAVHLGFSHTGEGKLHQRQIDLSRSWDEHVQDIAATDGSILLYFPWRVLTERDELRRVSTYREALADRFFYCPHDITMLPDIGGIMKVFAENGFIFNPEEVKLSPFGELLDRCVSTIGALAKDQLLIPNSNYQPPTQHLSLTSEEYRSIRSWRGY